MFPQYDEHGNIPILPRGKIRDIVALIRTIHTSWWELPSPPEIVGQMICCRRIYVYEGTGLTTDWVLLQNSWSLILLIIIDISETTWGVSRYVYSTSLTLALCVFNPLLSLGFVRPSFKPQASGSETTSIKEFGKLWFLLSICAFSPLSILSFNRNNIHGFRLPDTEAAIKSLELSGLRFVKEISENDGLDRQNLDCWLLFFWVSLSLLSSPCVPLLRMGRKSWRPRER